MHLIERRKEDGEVRVGQFSLRDLEGSDTLT